TGREAGQAARVTLVNVSGKASRRSQPAPPVSPPQSQQRGSVATRTRSRASDGGNGSRPSCCATNCEAVTGIPSSPVRVRPRFLRRSYHTARWRCGPRRGSNAERAASPAIREARLRFVLQHFRHGSCFLEIV